MRVDHEMRDCLKEIVNENCLLTLTQINHELRRRLPVKPEIHYHTVSRTLYGMLFRVKLARPLPADRNRPDVLNKSVDYATWFMNSAVVRSAATKSGRPEVMVDRAKFAASEEETTLRQWIYPLSTSRVQKSKDVWMTEMKPESKEFH